VTTVGNYDISVEKDTSEYDQITLLNPYGNVSPTLNWETLFAAYGKIEPNITKLRLKLNPDIDIDTTDIIGTIAVNPEYPNLLNFTVDTATLPANTIPAINGIIDPLLSWPGHNLPALSNNQRYLLVGPNTTEPVFPPGVSTSPWGINIVAYSNDIIQYNGVNWVVIFNAQAATGLNYVLNISNETQYVFNGKEWLYSYYGTYSPGYWRIDNIIQTALPKCPPPLPLPLPSAPLNLTVVSGENQNSLSWSGVFDATSYNIYWSLTSGTGKAGAKISGIIGTTYLHSGLTNGTTYYYVITAVNATGESLVSSQVSGTPEGDFNVYMKNVAYGNGTYVIPGLYYNNGKTFPTTEVATSTNGTDWTINELPMVSSWALITYGNSMFVLNGNNQIMFTSPDGVTWTQQLGLFCNNLYYFELPVPIFIAGDYISSDGVTWTSAYIPASVSTVAGISTGSAFYFIGNNPSGVCYVLTSVDGDIWTTTANPYPPGTSMSGIAYNGSKFIISFYTDAFGNPTNNISTSADGITWVIETVPITAYWSNIVYAAGLFVLLPAADSSSNPINIVLTSPDGVTWTSRMLPVSDTWNTLTYVNNLFFIISADQNILTSSNGTTWGLQTIPFIPETLPIVIPDISTLIGMCYGNGKFVGISVGPNISFISPDGIDWTWNYNLPDGESGDYNYCGMAFGDGTFVALTNSLNISGPNVAVISNNGINWNIQSMPTNNNWSYIVFGNGKFLAVDETNISSISTDGITWTNYTTPGNINSLAFGNSLFEIIADNVFYYSSDGITWTTGTGSAMNQSSIGYGDNIFTTVGSSEVGSVSTDGITWTPTTLPQGDWEQITYGAGIFIAINNDRSNPNYIKSSDGVTWSYVPAPGPMGEFLVYQNGLFMTSGYNGFFVSSDGINWNLVTIGVYP